ncbi:MAG: ribonuclease III [Ignavibacteriaceae bacterium]|nr:ribonuclease III [Ignavibacteriaceae bacterium]
MFKFLKKIIEKFGSKQILSKKNLEKLEILIDHKITDPQIFIEALTHRSYLDSKKFKVSNERLEFLGDAVLGFVVAEGLFKVFGDKDEGFLTKIRSNFVNRNSLYDAAVRIDLIHFVFVSKELMAAENLGIKTILADALEALLGAIYLHCGIDTCRNFILKYIFNPNIKMGVHLVDENYKSQLLEYAQAVKLEIPKYYVINEEGPEHERYFTVEVRIGQQALGEGRARNKKSAEQDAAKAALHEIAKSKKSS